MNWKALIIVLLLAYLWGTVTDLFMDGTSMYIVSILGGYVCGWFIYPLLKKVL